MVYFTTQKVYKMEQIKFKRYHFDMVNKKCYHVSYWGKNIKGSDFAMPNSLSNEDRSMAVDCQFIGIKDVNGKEVYEGDLITNGGDETWLIEPINSLERDGNYYGLCVSKDGNGDNYFYDKGFKNFYVSGNIYEDKYLRS